MELGFGSGHNVPLYPAAVRRVVAVEPSDVAWQLASGRLAAASTPVEWSAMDAQALPFDDQSFDRCLTTWTLCSIPDVAAALHEVRRVLRPDGTLHFVEHGLAPDESVRRWQRRLEPLQQRLFGGCHLTRSMGDLIAAGGFELVELDTFYMEGSPRFAGATYLGVARPRKAVAVA